MKRKLWKLTLRILRSIVLAIDDWIQRQEVLLRQPAEARQMIAEVNRSQSAMRERAIRKAREKQPRLRYVNGQFVRLP